MAIHSHRSLRHMAWANQKVYAAVQGLPEESLDAFISDPEWTARRILQHIVSGADWYVYCLTDQPWHEIATPRTMAEVATLAEQLDGFDRRILAEADRDDEDLEVEMEEGPVKVFRSTLIAQAVHHAAEHRAQLMDAVESRGFKALSLDDIDLWAFEAFERASGAS